MSNIKLGKTAEASVTVNEGNTAKTIWSGSLDVFATPMMIALMEQAACECLTDCLETGQTSVGTEINVSHTAASPLGAKITATATIEAVSGRKVDFAVTASDGVGEIGKGKQTRAIVDVARFMKNAEGRR
jgi:predicted thioesterase